VTDGHNRLVRDLFGVEGVVSVYISPHHIQIEKGGVFECRPPRKKKTVRGAVFFLSFLSPASWNLYLVVGETKPHRYTELYLTGKREIYRVL